MKFSVEFRPDYFVQSMHALLTTTCLKSSLQTDKRGTPCPEGAESWMIAE